MRFFLKENQFPKSSKLHQVALAYEVLIGFWSSGFQLTLIHISYTFMFSYTMSGVVVGVHYAALCLMPLIFGHISDRIGKKPILIIFLAILVTGCATALFSDSSYVFIAGIFLIGSGYGVCECLFAAAVSDNYPSVAEKKVLLMTFTYCLGAFISPFIIGHLLSIGITWRILLVIVGAGMIVILPLLLRIRFQSTQQTSKTKLVIGDLLKTKLFPVLFLLIIAYASIESGAPYFAGSFLTYELAAPDLAANTLSLYWGAMMISALVFSRMKVVGVGKISFLIVSSGVLLALLAFCQNQILALVLFTLIGALIGPVWALIIATGTKAFQKDSGTVASILMAGGGGGATVFPIFMGMLADAFGFRFSYGLIAIIGISAFTPWLWLKRRQMNKCDENE